METYLIFGKFYNTPQYQMMHRMKLTKCTPSLSLVSRTVTNLYLSLEASFVTGKETCRTVYDLSEMIDYSNLMNLK
jgi:hypothetical protein